METRWLNFFLRFSGFVFNLKQRVVQKDGLTSVLPTALLLIGSECILAVISLPLFIFVSPDKVQETGFLFPAKQKDVRASYQSFIVRRKISLFTVGSAGGIYALKLLIVGIVSLYLLGATPLLAAIQNWDFSVAGDYTYDSAKIEVTGGVGQLKNLGGVTSGATTNPDFSTNTTGWTYADWDQTGGESNVVGARVTSGGNPGGYINVSFPAGANDEFGGYWTQSFATSVADPTTTLGFNWEITAFDTTPVPNTFKLYAFVDTGSGVPVIGTEVWSSGEITGTSGWASVSSFDVSSKVTAAGTYYLKIAAWLETPGSSSGPFTLGYDNVQLNWTKTTVSYDTTSPTINPTTSLTMSKTVSWNAFTETATKNGGEISYQLSDDDGASWQYWTGSAWGAAGATNYNVASVVNTNIGTFPKTNNKIRWKAFLTSDGLQQVILDNVAIDYTENSLPVISSVTPSQGTSTGRVYIPYTLTDADSDPESLTTYEYSLTGSFTGEQVTMTAATGDPSHGGISSLTSSPTGVSHTFVWDAFSQLGAVYNTTVYVRLRANDGVGNGAYEASTAFTVDYVNPVTSSVTATQTAGSTNVSITYTLTDNTSDNLLVEVQASNDDGSTWTVPITSVTGAVGAGQSTGAGQVITWNAGADFTAQQLSTMKVQVRAKDKYQNQGSYVASSAFALDTLAPATLTTANLQAQPNAGDATALIGGSFTEVNPNTNDFSVAINGGAYGSSTSGTTNTATPSNQATTVGSTLNGHDYISKVKIVHVDDFSNASTNENTSPSSAFKYVKPYTPQAPTLSAPVTTVLDLTINPNVSEASDVPYALFETSTSQYVQADGTLGASAVWEIMGTGSGQWGNNTGISGKVHVSGLSSPVANYIFKVKSRNPSDTGNAASSESAFSATTQITNTAPSISLGSIAQTTDGTKYVTINYTGTDGQGDINSLTVFEYSRDNSAWSTMTEKSGVDSDGTSNLTFLSGGTAHDFMWDVGTDLASVEDSTVYIRLRSSDAITTSSLVTSSAFEIDTITPAVSSVSASQNAGARTVSFTYTLTDVNNSLVELDISEDGGSTWTVTDTSVTGHVGTGVTPGSKTITWNAGVDFDNQYQTDLQVRIRANDTFGNQGIDTSSSNFTVDTKDPVVANVTAVQDSAADTFTFHYDVSEDSGNVTVGLEVSSNGGSTWVVPITTASGDIGSVVPGINKTITWNAATDYSGFEKTNMMIRVTATDAFSNTSNASSSAFSLDSLAPRVTGVGASQTLGSTNVSITYTLADQNNSLVELDISEDGGSTWTVTDTSVTGDVGAGIAAGSKTITWNAGADFDEQAQSDIQVRVRAKDVYEHQSANTESANFALDTLNPATNVAADLQSQPNAGDTTALIGGSFTETNPNTNDFSVALNNGAYGSTSAGNTNTASPANHATPVGATLDGNDFVSKVKIVHADDYGQMTTNENTSPSASLKFVKPYTPATPTVGNPTNGTVDVMINKNASETDGLEYAIFETSQSLYVQTNGTLGASAVWRTTIAWGTATVNGLVNDSYTYQFKVKSRNTSDVANAASSESTLSGGASSVNQSPVIAIGSVAQTMNGTKYATINYTGTDLESESVNVITAEYSRNGSTWFTMTEKSGVGSDGISGLTFAYTGTPHDFMWDVATDLPDIEDATVFIRLQANDATSSGAIAESSAFIVDTKIPVISSVTAAQQSGSNDVIFTYTLTDLSISTIDLDISDDAGVTWTVAHTTATGDVGANVSPGAGKSITWNPGVDFSGQEQSDLRVRIRATDDFGNPGVDTSSANFSVDTESPRISNVTASQDSGLNTVTIQYDIADANTSDVVIDISEDNGSTWGVAKTTLTGDIGSGISSGTGKTVTWNAAVDFPNREQSGMMVRVHATDVHANLSGDVSSSAFSVDTLAPVISNVSAVQTLGTDNVVFTYDLSDSGSVTVALDISNNSGSTWTVTDTSVTGAVGAGQTTGTGKIITWNAGTDASNVDLSTMRVRLRGTDTFNNTNTNVESADFLLDTKNPATATVADLISQPTAGSTTALIGGSFTETNPNTNDFYVALNTDAYGSLSAGDTNTASPSNHATSVGVTLDGNDYISKVKIIHTDDYGHSVTNETTSPTVGFKYVKPYTPQAPSVTVPQNTSVDVTVVPNASETTGLEYAIFETSQSKYVKADGTLGVAAVWRTSVAWGTTTVTGLTSPVAQYHFEVKSRNTSDTLNASSSESDFSAQGSITNTAPSISIASAAQQTGTNYALIEYTGTDAQNDTNSLTTFEYSTDNSIWNTMTEKSGVGSDGTSNLIFASTGTVYTFAWDIATDLPNTGDSTVYVRLQSSDTIAGSNVATSSAFAIDTLGPVITNMQMSQTAGTDLLTFTYDLADSTAANNTVTLLISSNSGSTWVVPATTASGDVGASVSSGTGRIISWNAGVDFNNQENSTMQIQLQGTDAYGNAGTAVTSSNFTVDTKSAVVSGVSAAQVVGTNNILIDYTLADLSSGGLLVEFSVSSDNGGTWTVPVNTYSGEMGSGQTTGVKQFTWNAGTDFAGEAHTDMIVRARAKDYYNNQGSFTSSSAFALDTKASVVSNVVASQNAGARTVAITYDLADDTSTDVTVDLEISEDNGTSWTVTHSSSTGAVGSGQTAGTGKTITWDAGTDFDGQFQSDMKVRVRATDKFSNQGSFVASSMFTVDTTNPIVSNVTASQTVGTNNVAISYDLVDDTSSNLTTILEISSNNGSTWVVPTSSATGDVGASQSPGIGKTITWNAGTDFSNQYASTMKVRVRATDSYNNQGTNAESSVFTVDTKAAVVSNVTASQSSGSTIVSIAYDLADDTSSNVTTVLEISSNNGSTWVVPTTSATGNVGTGQSTGTGKTIAWNAGIDFNNQFNTTMMVHIRANDAFSNTSGFIASSAFTIDTKSPVVSNVTAVQNIGSTNVIVSYDLADDTTTGLATVLEISSDNGLSWIVPATTVSGNVGTAQSTGTGKTITWAADTDFDNQFQIDMKVRVRATDSFANQSGFVSSVAFTLDTANPVVSNVTSSQTLGSDNVVILYDLADDSSTNLSVVLEISSNGGSTWTVPTTSATGNVGTGQSTGTGKSITWNAGTDFSGNVNATMQVRVQGSDKFTNQGNSAVSSNFSVDTKNPITATAADLKAQPNAGDVSVLIGGSFTEENPNTNDFSVALNGGAYGTSSAGDADTATPTDHIIAVGTTLDGNDFTSKVKIVHTDDFGHVVTNENTSPTAAFAYVKPYTPAAPTVENPTSNTVDVIVNKNVAEISGLEYAIFESTQNKYVQTDGSLGVSAIWQTGTTWGTVTVTGLSSPVSIYVFKTKSRNASDTAHLGTSESNLSPGASVATSAPLISIDSVAQTAASGYVMIQYTGTDAQNDLTQLLTTEYSLNGTDWLNMTEKSGVGSDGKINLPFTASGASLTFAWDAAADVSNFEGFIYIRLMGNDGTQDGNLATSSTFALDVKGPVVSNVTASQAVGSNLVNISYDVSDLTSSISTILEISSNDGSTWVVPTTSATGNIGTGQTTGTGKTISWNAGTDFNNQFSSTMKVRVRATDSFINSGSFTESSAFAVDTKVAVVSNVSASQSSGSTVVSIAYDLADDTSSNLTTVLEISSNNGSTWIVPTTSATGNIGTGQTTGTGKTISWNAGTDFNNQFSSTMNVRVRATDNFSNQGAFSLSSAFTLDTNAPTVSSVVAVQNSGSTNVVISYNLADNTASNLTTVLEISSDNGSTWIVPVITVSGNIGTGQTTGTGKSITWAADTDFDNQFNVNMKARVRATDSLGNMGTTVSSSAFTLDTENPVVSNVTASQSSGSTTVSIAYDLADDSISNLTTVLEISSDNGSTWTVPTTSTTGNVGSGQSTGTGKTITWSADTDFDGQFNNQMKVRVHAVDRFTNQGNNAESSSFILDTANPIISNVTAAQIPSTDTVSISYDLADNSSSNLSTVLEISSNDGSTWIVPTTSATGDVGSGVSTGTGKTIAWNAGTDFNNHFSADMKVRVRATDSFTNQGTNAESSVFTVDTMRATITNVLASQTDGARTVAITFDLADDASSLTNVTFEASSDNGSTWTVPTVTSNGNIGAGQSNGTGKIITWNVGTDFDGQFQTDMKVRVQATDAYGNASVITTSSAFSVDTSSPIVSNVIASQTSGSNLVTILYDLSDDTSSNVTVALQISSNSGSSWIVPATTVSGNVNGSQSTGSSKTITWNAGTDFANQDISTMRVRVQTTDRFTNIGSQTSSTDFVLDTNAPVGLSGLTNFLNTHSLITLHWTSATDTHFRHYELWYGTNETDVANRSGSATKWDETNDPLLTDALTSSTTITGLTITSDVFVKIFATDDFGNVETTDDIRVSAPAPTPIEITVSGGGGGGCVGTACAPVLPSIEDVILPIAPILSALPAVENEKEILVRGLAEQGSMIDLYDHGAFIRRLTDATTSDGIFAETIRLEEGVHLLTVKATDIAGNISPFSNEVDTRVDLTPPKAQTIVTSPISVTGPATQTPTIIVSPPVSIPKPTIVPAPAPPITPSAAAIQEVTRAVELPGLSVPMVAAATTTSQRGDRFTFRGTAFPNARVAVYLHSTQALLYQTTADQKGNWEFDHSQSAVELTEGTHSIYAVAVDPNASVKSRPSEFRLFTVKKNVFAQMFGYLNIYTTLIALLVLIVSVFWLSRLKKKGVEQV